MGFIQTTRPVLYERSHAGGKLILRRRGGSVGSGTALYGLTQLTLLTSLIGVCLTSACAVVYISCLTTIDS